MKNQIIESNIGDGSELHCWNIAFETWAQSAVLIKNYTFE